MWCACKEKNEKRKNFFFMIKGASGGENVWRIEDGSKEEKIIRDLKCRNRFQNQSPIPPFFLFFPLGLSLFPILLTTMDHPRIHTSPVLRQNSGSIKRRISLRSTKHSQKIPSPIAMREWIRGWWAGDEWFVCLIPDLQRRRKDKGRCKNRERRSFRKIVTIIDRID